MFGNLDDAIGVEGNGIDAESDEEFGEVRVVAGPLSTDANLAAFGMGAGDQVADGGLDGFIAFVEKGGDHLLAAA